MSILLDLKRKAKGLAYLLQIDRVTPFRLLTFVSLAAELSRWIRKHKTEGWNDFYNPRFVYRRRFDLYTHLIEQEDLNAGIDYLEFGVAKGDSFKWWVEHVTHPEARFYGFDTFTGLPEAWGPFEKGAMSGGGSPPELDDSRHAFFQGLFQQTLPTFLGDYRPTRRKVIHMDADIYSATLYVLTQISDRLRSGDILIFDEFNVPMHEFRAFSEWTGSFYIDYEVLGSVNNFYQVAFKIR